MDGIGKKWTVQKARSGGSSGMQVDGPKRSNGLSMLVADFTAEVCWWKIGDVGDKSG